MVTNSRSVKERAKLSVLAALAIVAALVLVGSNTVFAVSANVSPSSQRLCQGATASWHTTWGNTPPFDVSFYSGGYYGGFDRVGVDYTSEPYEDGMNDAGTIPQDLYVVDYYGSASSRSYTYVTQGGLGGCPASPAP